MLKLNLGCGDKKIPGFINIDIRLEVCPDAVMDVFILSAIRDNSIDLIYACHILEHARRGLEIEILRSWYRLLKPGGMLRIAVPDFDAINKHYCEYGDLNILLGLLYGRQDHDYNVHFRCWDEQTLTSALLDIGFILVYRYDWRETEHAMIDDYSQSFLPHMDRISGRLMSLNLEAVK